MDLKFTEQIGAWLTTPKDERDYPVGVLYLLKWSVNSVMYMDIVAQLDNKREFVEYQLQKYYNFRVQSMAHEQFMEISAKVDEIVKNNISLAVEVDEKT